MNLNNKIFDIKYNFFAHILLLFVLKCCIHISDIFI